MEQEARAGETVPKAAENLTDESKGRWSESGFQQCPILINEVGIQPKKYL